LEYKREMRYKVKLLVLTGLLATMMVPLGSCAFFDRLAAPIERITHPPALSVYEAIVIVQIAGVPYMDDYYEKTVGAEEAQAHGKIGLVEAFGDWDADYQGKGMWEVTGSVRNDKWGDCQTIWTIDEKTNEVKLTGFNCD